MSTPGVSPSPVVTPSSSPEEEIIIDEDIPLGEVEIDDEEIPAGTVADPGGRLPQTGENSPMPIYLAGAGLIAAGFILSRVFRRRKQE